MSWHFFSLHGGKTFFPQISRKEAILAAELSALFGPWRLPGVNTGMYINEYCGNLYHNTTVLFSRAWVPAILVLFLSCRNQREGNLQVKHVFIFGGTLFWATVLKPSFAFLFLPSLAVLLIGDFIRSKAKRVKNELIIGCAVVPSGIVCIVQYVIILAGWREQTAALACIVLLLRNISIMV